MANMGDLTMTFRPLHDRVLVRRVDEDTKTAGGIIIPDSAQEKPSQGAPESDDRVQRSVLRCDEGFTTSRRGRPSGG